jgi:transcription elongation GreA/GreB family factor
MSRAFVKETDADGDVGLPERPISAHPNLVTREGLATIQAEVTRLANAFANARIAGDQMALAGLSRDLRYWQRRLATAEPVDHPADTGTAQFGSTVTILRDDGRRQSYRIVGEDEADPNRGTVSHVSPLAQAVLGRSVGDEITLAGHDVEIVAID